MKFSYTLLYVKNLKSTVSFYEKAFGLKCRFIHESGLYAEMETGSTTLAFTQHEFLETLNLKYLKASPSSLPLGMQISFEPEDVDKACQKAIKAGAKEVIAPNDTPYGWRCAFLRDIKGILVELAKCLEK